MFNTYQEGIKSLAKELHYYMFVENQLRQECLIPEADFMEKRCAQIRLALRAMREKKQAVDKEKKSMDKENMCAIVSHLQSQLELAAQMAEDAGCSNLGGYFRYAADRILADFL